MLIKIGSHLLKEIPQGSLCINNLAHHWTKTVSPASMWKHTGGEKYINPLRYSGIVVNIFRHEGNELAFLRESILRFTLPVNYNF